MSRFVIWCVCLMCCMSGMAQPGKVYRSVDDIKNPEDVYILRLRGKRLTEIPKEVFACINLKELDLSRNRLSEVPSEIVNLQQLEVLRLGRNNIDSLPIEVAQLSHLVELDMNRNPLSDLPEAMGYMLSLQRLILWSTAVYSLPDSFAELDTRLQLLDLRSCLLTLDEQHAIRALLPTPRIQWDQACNCK